MIRDTYENALPLFTCAPEELADTQLPPLTEVFCCAVYGAPLSRETLGARRDEALKESQDLWRSPNGPSWLRECLELIRAKKRRKFARGTSTDDKERIRCIDKASRQWLEKDRKKLSQSSWSAEHSARKKQLADMSPDDAIAHALEEADRIEREENELNQRAATFIEQLNESITSGSLELHAIPIDTITEETGPPLINRAPHVTIPKNCFLLPLAYDIYANMLEVTLEGQARSRGITKTLNSMPRWVDIRLKLDQARALLAQCAPSPESLLRAAVAQSPDRRTMSRSEFIKIAHERFGVSKRNAGIIWGQVVPTAWKKPGAIPGSSRKKPRR